MVTLFEKMFYLIFYRSVKHDTKLVTFDVAGFGLEAFAFRTWACHQPMSIAGMSFPVVSDQSHGIYRSEQLYSMCIFNVNLFII